MCRGAAGEREREGGRDGEGKAIQGEEKDIEERKGRRTTEGWGRLSLGKGMAVYDDLGKVRRREGREE